MQQVKYIDQTEAELFQSPLYEKAFKRESVIFNKLSPIEIRQIANAPTVCPDVIQFSVPNTGMLAVADSYMSFKVKIACGNMVVGDKIVQKDGKLQFLTAATGAYATLKTLPISSRCFLNEVQVMKQNVGSTQLNFVQRNKHRDTHNYNLISQDYANQMSDYILYNSADKILYTAAGTENAQTIWVNF